MKDGDFFRAYIDDKGIKHDLNPEKTKIIAKGSDQQNAAFLIQKDVYLV